MQGGRRGAQGVEEGCSEGRGAQGEARGTGPYEEGDRAIYVPKGVPESDRDAHAADTQPAHGQVWQGKCGGPAGKPRRSPNLSQGQWDATDVPSARTMTWSHPAWGKTTPWPCARDRPVTDKRQGLRAGGLWSREGAGEPGPGSSPWPWRSGSCVPWWLRANSRAGPSSSADSAAY